MQLGKEEARRISEMTLSEKLGQMFVTGFPAEEMDESFRALVKDKKVGNVILFKDNLKSAEQIVGLVARYTRAHLRRNRRVPADYGR